MHELKNYIPILTPKRGELGAIKELKEKELSKFTPLFDTHQMSIKGGKYDKSLDQHLHAIINALDKQWPKEKLFILDYSQINLDLRMEENIHPFKFLCDSLKEKQLIFSPTIGLDRDEAYLNALTDFINENPDYIITIRLLEDDVENPRETKDAIHTITSCLHIEIAKCNLIIDFKGIENKDIDSLIDLLSEFNLILPFQAWLSFTLAASGFPSDLSKISRDSNQSIQRKELNLWRAAIDGQALIGRKPNFGDYIISPPDRANVDVLTMQRGGKIRYTTLEDWVIFKGHGFKKDGDYSQYRALSESLIKSKHYLGEDYSWGDKRAFACAEKTVGPGSLETWIKIDTNHHLTLVGEQIASSDAFSRSH
jgi:hypothetical protein